MDFIEYSGKTVDDALTNACRDLGVTSDDIESIIVEKGSSGFLGFNVKPAVIKARKKCNIEDKLKEFLNNVFQAMNMDVKITLDIDEEANLYNVELEGNDMGVLIGKRGQTLDSLQYLTNLAINRNSEQYIKVKIDTENYRQRRKDTLENLAKNIAYKVKRTKKTVSLEPMNPFERRIIHSALQNDRYVVTHSEGEEPYRHVVVALKREGRDSREYRERRDRYRNNNNHNNENNVEE